MEGQQALLSFRGCHRHECVSADRSEALVMEDNKARDCCVARSRLLLLGLGIMASRASAAALQTHWAPEFWCGAILCTAECWWHH